MTKLGREKNRLVSWPVDQYSFHSIRTNENESHLYVKRTTVLILTGHGGEKDGWNGGRE